MNAVLIQIAAVIGFCLGALTFFVCILNGATLLTSILRASVSMVLATLFVTLFFRFFAKVLYNFIAQKQKEQQEAEAAEAEPDNKRDRRRDFRTRRPESSGSSPTPPAKE